MIRGIHTTQLSLIKVLFFFFRKWRGGSVGCLLRSQSTYREFRTASAATSSSLKYLVLTVVGSLAVLATGARAPSRNSSIVEVAWFSGELFQTVNVCGKGFAAMLKSFLKSHNVPTSARPESSKESHDFRAMQDRMGRLTTQDSLSRQISAAPPLHSMNDGNFFKACSMPANLAATSPPVNFRSLSPIAQRDDRSQLWSPTSPQSDSSLKPNPLDLPYPTSPESVWSPERGLSPTRLRSPDHSSRRENGGVFKKQRPKRFTHAVPSNFCHICCRSSKRVRKVICKNIEIGICRKVICEKCFTA